MDAGFGTPCREPESGGAPGGSTTDDALRSVLARLSVSLDQIHALLGELDAASHPGARHVAIRSDEADAAAGADDMHIAARAYRPLVSRTGHGTRASMPDLICDSTRRAKRLGALIVYGGGPSAFRSQ